MSFYGVLPLLPGKNTIRLLTMLPPHDDDIEGQGIVTCTLGVAQIEEADFTALSYAWGDPAVQEKIVVNGTEVSVTTNLESALRHLRAAKQSKWLWVDALCINQSDAAEKSDQVRRMAGIYSHASQTVAWLGPEADASGLAMRFLRSTGEELLKLRFTTTVQQPENIQSFSSAATGSPEYRQKGPETIDATARRIKWNYPFRAVRRLSQRAYWKRLWILQEFALSSSVTVRCGNETISGTVFRAAMQFRRELGLFLRSHLGDRDAVAAVDWRLIGYSETDEEVKEYTNHDHYALHSSLSGPTHVLNCRIHQHRFERRQMDQIASPLRLFNLLEQTSTPRLGGVYRLDARDPRDRIYGILGMQGVNAQKDLVHVDYETSIDTLYTEVAHMLLRNDVMRVLCYSGLHTHNRMPSWAPDWRKSVSRSYVRKDLFKPAGTLRITTPRFRDGIMSLQCVILDKVLKMGSQWMPEPSTRAVSTLDPMDHAISFLEEVSDLVNAATGCPLPFMTQERWLEGCWRIPIADQYLTPDGHPCRASSEAARGWECLTNSQLAQDMVEEGDYATMYLNMMHYTRGNKVVQTRKSYVGLGPVGSKKGDIMVIVPGLSSLLVLRRVTWSRTRKYRIIGQGYLYGLMDGEAINADTKLETLDIC